MHVCAFSATAGTKFNRFQVDLQHTVINNKSYTLHFYNIFHLTTPYDLIKRDTARLKTTAIFIK